MTNTTTYTYTEPALLAFCGLCRPHEDWPRASLPALLRVHDLGDARLPECEDCGARAFWVVAVPAYTNAWRGLGYERVIGRKASPRDAFRVVMAETVLRRVRAELGPCGRCDSTGHVDSHLAPYHGPKPCPACKGAKHGPAWVGGAA